MSFLRRIAATLNSSFRRPALADPTPGIQLESYAERLRREIELFGAIERVHDLPEIFHFWSNRYVRPKLESVLGVSNIDDFFIKYIREFCTAHPGKEIRIVSIGAGNSDTEIRIAQKLRDQGLCSFRFRCLDINPSMLERGRQLASDLGLREEFEFVESDIADWREDEPVPVVMAVHSLHHIVALETIFERIKEAIGKSGYFLVCDMVGRNGHMRWPEALGIVHSLWKEMPDRYKYNHQLKRFEEMYENWDCSTEGFEGIRAQDILPLLVRTFDFESFVPYGNIPDIFVDRGFGHNFDINNSEDTEFIDRVGSLNDQLISDGVIKPTQMVAAMRSRGAGMTACFKHWTPKFCIRPVS